MFSWLFPDFCIGCERWGTQLCPHCIHQLCCIDPQLAVNHFRTDSIENIWSAVEYRDLAEKIIQIAKYERYWSYTKLMAQLMFVMDRDKLRGIDLLIPVPITPSRQWWRGFNQAEKIARHLSQLSGIPSRSDCMKRTSAGNSQVGRNRQERLSLPDTFMAHPVKLRGRTVCLVDDVVTTGSTLEACAQALLQVEVKKVIALTFAKA